MPRTPRLYKKALCYHIYNRAVNRLPILQTSHDKEHFARLLREYKELCGVRVYHWAVMDNHYHILAEVVFENLRPFASGIQQVYATLHHHIHGSAGVFWQGRFKSRPVEIGDALVRCGRYIERNPVRGGKVENAWDYRWSSASYYVCGINDHVTDPNVYLDAERMTPRDRKVYAMALMSKEDEEWYHKQDKNRCIGSKRFASQLTIEHGRHRRRRGRPVKRCE